MDLKFIGKPPATIDLEKMPERGSHHRRSHSDTSFRVATNFDDLLLFDPSDFDISTFPLPSPTTSGGGVPGACAAVPMTIDSDESSGQSSRPRQAGDSTGGHLRSLSVDSDFFDSLGFAGTGEEKFGGRRAGHNRSNSMDGSPTTSFEDCVKKAMAPDKLAELARSDPKRAKRVLANRQSAARSKERKVRYTSELEKRVQTLQTEATNLSAQLTIFQRDNADLSAHNKELKLKLEGLEQEAQLREDLNAALKEELQHLREQNIHLGAISGNPSFVGVFNQLASQLAMQQLDNPPSQQSQPGMPPPPPSHQPFNGQRRPNFMDFNKQK